MSRLKNFTRSLMSSYALVGVNIFYTLGAVPLALHYLSKPEFGLWALTLQIAGYISLVDLGMNSSVARILIDHKDDRASGRYGGVIQSGFWVGAAQGAITLIVGLSMVWFMGTWLRVPTDLPSGLSLDSSGFISGTPASIGTNNFAVKVTDSNGNMAAEVMSLAILNNNAVRDFTVRTNMNIGGTLTVATTNLPSGTIGVAYNCELAANGGQPPYRWAKVPLSSAFLWLMIGQVLLTAATFATRIFNQLLFAWQRIDVINYIGISQLAVGFAMLWLGFHCGWGVFSLLAGIAASWIFGTVFNVIACHRLGLMPGAGQWGRPSRGQFRELFNYGADVFLITIGMQLIGSSQTVLVSRQLGLEAAALWSVMTKAFTLVFQIVAKIVGNAVPAFAEMHVRREEGRLWHRFQGLFLATNAFAIFCGVQFAACNGLFVTVWTQGRFSWPALNNILLGAWLVVSTQQTCHNEVVKTLKQIGTLKYIFLLEGIVCVGVALVVLPIIGITGLLIGSLVATTLFTWASGVWRIGRLSGLGWQPLVWDWQKPGLRMLAVMVPCALVLHLTLRGSPVWLRLAVNAAVLGAVGVWAGLRLGLPAELLSEIAGKLPPPLRRLLAVLTGRACGHGNSGV
jgi:O-antigen/teichoic acid export membrane protein